MAWLSRPSDQDGYVLALVVGLSLLMLVLTLQVLIPLSGNQAQMQTVMYNRISQRAAEAGAIYAKWCLDQNGGIAQWTSAKQLMPNTDCTGTPRPGSAQANHVAKEGAVFSTFYVPPPSGDVTSSLRINPGGLLYAAKADGSIGVAVQQKIAAQVTSAPTPWKQIAGGEDQTCGIAANDQAYCWGENSFGQLGNGTTTDSSVPVAIAQGAMPSLTVKAISAGNGFTCAIGSDDKAYCWGDGAAGRLGTGSNIDSSVPVAVVQGAIPQGVTVKAISLTAGIGDGTVKGHACAIASNGNVYCWGQNTTGELGNNSTTNSNSPVAVKTNGALAGLTVKAITAEGDASTCAIASNNNGYCWGNDAAGQLGDNSTLADSHVPVAVKTNGVLAGLTLKAVTSSGSHVCAIASNDQAYCWGNNGSGQHGNNSTTSSPVPVAVMQGAMPSLTVKAIDTGSADTCAIGSNDQEYCWGENNSGRLGDGTTTDRHKPVAVSQGALPSGATIQSIGNGRYQTCAVTFDDLAYCWGSNLHGQLGNGTLTTSLVPAAVLTDGLPRVLTMTIY